MVEADIRSWGAHARRFAGRHTTAGVAGVFARSVHLRAGGDVLCIGEAGIGNGPLNATLAAASWQRIAERLPIVGSKARVGSGAIALGGALLRTHAALDWRPPRWPPLAERGALAAAVHRLARLARGQAPAHGLAPIALGSRVTAATAWHRLARPRLERFRRWTGARLSRPIGAAAPVDLLGLGPGLTPSGDDLLCGALVALHAIGRPDVAHDLYAAIAAAPAATTSVLSWALLGAAAVGEYGEALHALLIALLEHREVAAELSSLSRIGHTSGWDALAGAMVVLEAASDAAPPTQHDAQRGTAASSDGE